MTLAFLTKVLFTRRVEILNLGYKLGFDTVTEENFGN